LSLLSIAKAEQELIDIVPHFGIRDNDGVLNFISVCGDCFLGMYLL
jgi:hypothetical protein